MSLSSELTVWLITAAFVVTLFSIALFFCKCFRDFCIHIGGKK